MAGGTNFELIDHAQLRKMVDSTDPSKVLSRGTMLQSAARVLRDLSSALKSHAENIHWEGPAAENFKTWVGNLQQSAGLLSDYSKSAGDAMHQAGEALSTAKAAVPGVPDHDVKTVSARTGQGSPTQAALNIAALRSPDPTTATVDAAMKSVNKNWVSEADAQAAAQRVYLAHQEAIHQMEKLGQAYDAATQTLTGLKDVVLPGTPDTTSNKSEGTTISGGGGGYVGSGGSVRSSARSGGSVGGSSSPSGGSYGGGGTVAPHPPGSGSGSGGSGTPGHVDPIPPSGGGHVPPPAHDPGSTTPPTVPSGPIDRTGTGLDSLPPAPTLPGQTGPVSPVGGGSLPPDVLRGTTGYPGGPGGGTAGYPSFPGGGPVPGFPVGSGGGSIPGRSGGSIPGRGGGSIPGTSGGSVPGRTVPFGGGTVPGKSGTPGLPSGTVFGAREAQAGRGGTAGGTGGMGGMHPGMGGHGGGGGAAGGSRGRGLTSTGGGTVGGRKGPTPGGEFTPGGTGLRRAAAAGAAEGEARAGQNGMMAPGSSGHAGKSGRDRRKRADYLLEDEETWTSGTPQSNPNVVE
ncbi:hypothetical protein [Kitasatospora sp. NPDC048538]|uniref:WXG100 family type VII secretion target n=1 Tax=unclassified Kitasatospora TaxID=2633591 RepID=UPI0033CA93E0